MSEQYEYVPLPREVWPAEIQAAMAQMDQLREEAKADPIVALLVARLDEVEAKIVDAIYNTPTGNLTGGVALLVGES